MPHIDVGLGRSESIDTHLTILFAALAVIRLLENRVLRGAGPGRTSGSCTSPSPGRAQTTFALLAECFEVLGGVPDRMDCPKGEVVANVVVPTPNYVRLTVHYGFGRTSLKRRPGQQEIGEVLVGYAKRGTCSFSCMQFGSTRARWPPG